VCTLLNKYFISFSAYFTQVSLSPAQIKMSSPRNKSSFDTANQEWAEILLTADKQSSTSVRLAPADPTPVVVDVNKALSAQDLISLKKRDPFLYYSIPGVCEATVRHKQVDMHQLARDGLSRNCASCPASIQTVTTTSEQTTRVKRSTRVSFECPADLLMEDLMDDLVEMEMEESLVGSGLDDLLGELFSIE